MKFLILIWAVFLLIFSFTDASADQNPISETFNLTNSTNLAKQGCNSRCGDLIVPYPFGIGLNSNCSIGEGFDVYCNTSFNPPRASFTNRSGIWIKQISDSTLRTSNIVASRCYIQNGSSSVTGFYGIIAIFKEPYTFSQLNKITVIGCDDYGRLTIAPNQALSRKGFGRTRRGGCMAFCPEPEEVAADDCSGNGCCQSPIPKDLNSLGFRLYTMLESNDTIQERLLNPCAYAFVGDPNAFKFNGLAEAQDTNFLKRIEDTVPIVLEWAIGNLNCSEAETTPDFACQSNSECVDSKRKTGGYRCVCIKGYKGNPYLSPGCTDVNECNDLKNFPCYGTCVNTIGDYICKCKAGFSGDGTLQDGCKRKPFSALRLSLGMGLGFLTLLIGLSVLHSMVQKRNLLKQREKFYKQNGGDLLEDKLKTTGFAGSSIMKIFRVEELEKATDNFAKDRILGKGGNGTVYKGILPNNREVAIKKSQRLDKKQREQFINEMIILAQLNHPNVVQLLGCCLETDVPLLVYEFVFNGTLYRHIHKICGKNRLSWDCRLRIAHESAGALAYLHSHDRFSIIYHRDVKSSNILLDEKYTAKIADFGASRLLPLGHDRVTTRVQGTRGYLDPEYQHKGQLTDKSDVYSFGVVLAELLTCKKPVFKLKKKDLEEKILATYFLKAREEKGLSEILDCHVVKEATEEQLEVACDLVCRCLDQASGNRPGMEEVTMKLEALMKMGKHPSNIISQENYTQASSLMIESEGNDHHNVPLAAVE